MIMTMMALALSTHPVQSHTDCLLTLADRFAAEGRSPGDYATSIEPVCRQTREALRRYQAPRMKASVADPDALVRDMIAALEAEAVRSYTARVRR